VRPVQATLGRSPPCARVLRLGCRTALEARHRRGRGVAGGGGAGGLQGVRSRGAGAEMPFEFPIRPPPGGDIDEEVVFHRVLHLRVHTPSPIQMTRF